MALEEPQDAKLYFEQDMTQPECHGLAGGSAVVYSARCPEKETPNEDAAGLIPFDDHSAILVVADGLGGVQAGELAAQVTIEALRSALEQARADGAMLRTAILDGIEHANHAVQDLALGAATTLVVVEIDAGAARPFHVGDSMVLATGQRGRIKLQTVSHSPVGFAVEAGLIDETEAMYHEDRHIVSNVVGTPGMRVEVGATVTLAQRDTLILASDGLFDNLHTAEIIDRIRKGPLDNVARRLVDDARHRMTHPADNRPCKPDDLTFVLFRRHRPEIEKTA